MNYRKLHKLIEERKVKKADLIRKTGLSKTTIDYVLNGNDFRVSTLEKIAAALHVRVGFFFDEEVNEQYNATGEQSFAVKHIANVDQRRQSAGVEVDELKATIASLQQQLLEARAEIIELLRKQR